MRWGVVLYNHVNYIIIITIRSVVDWRRGNSTAVFVFDCNLVDSRLLMVLIWILVRLTRFSKWSVMEIPKTMSLFVAFLGINSTASCSVFIRRSRRRCCSPCRSLVISSMVVCRDAIAVDSGVINFMLVLYACLHLSKSVSVLQMVASCAFWSTMVRFKRLV